MGTEQESAGFDSERNESAQDDESTYSTNKKINLDFTNKNMLTEIDLAEISQPPSSQGKSTRADDSMGFGKEGTKLTKNLVKIKGTPDEEIQEVGSSEEEDAPPKPWGKILIGFMIVFIPFFIWFAVEAGRYWKYNKEMDCYTGYQNKEFKCHTCDEFNCD